MSSISSASRWWGSRCNGGVRSETPGLFTRLRVPIVPSVLFRRPPSTMVGAARHCWPAPARLSVRRLGSPDDWPADLSRHMCQARTPGPREQRTRDKHGHLTACGVRPNRFVRISGRVPTLSTNVHKARLDEDTCLRTRVRIALDHGQGRSCTERVETREGDADSGKGNTWTFEDETEAQAMVTRLLERWRRLAGPERSAGRHPRQIALAFSIPETTALRVFPTVWPMSAIGGFTHTVVAWQETRRGVGTGKRV